ncbi:MAG: hypothetical protein HQM00_00715, partial [Magnetococcales bacterium]|nr:hypothetical protein [Magnetococcales bacterium]
MKHPLLAPLTSLLERRGPPYPLLGNLPGSALSWMAVEITRHAIGPVVLITGTSTRAESLYREMLFFAEHLNPTLTLMPFPAWETLPFERLSPYG